MERIASESKEGSKGRPRTIGRVRKRTNQDILIFQNAPERYNLLIQHDKEVLEDWIKCSLVHSKTRLKNAYQLKYVLESDIGLYLISGEFSGAMLALGFEMSEPKELWHHREFYCNFTKDCRSRLHRLKNWII